MGRIAPEHALGHVKFSSRGESRQAKVFKSSSRGRGTTPMKNISCSQSSAEFPAGENPLVCIQTKQHHNNQNVEDCKI